MALHNHPGVDIHLDGLQDLCPRCNEHAARPLVWLDDRMLGNLTDRLENGEPGRSGNERRALAELERLMKVRG